MHRAARLWSRSKTKENIMMSHTLHLASSIDKEAAARLSSALKNVRGIHTVDIPPDGKKVRVIFDDGLTSVQELAAVMERAGHANTEARTAHGAGGCCGGCG
jgi:copper chaperone CopZ